MKAIGILVLVVGVLAFFYGFNMDTTVATDFGGRRIHNIGLMNDRQSIIIFAGVLAVIGAVFFGLAGENAPTPETHVRCPDCKELVLKEAKVCKHCGCKLIPQK